MLTAQRELTSFDGWYAFWAARGDAYEELARSALRKGRRQSAGELFWQACLSWHYAQFLWFHDPQRAMPGSARKVALYREAAPLFAVPAERFEIPFESFTIPGYLRLPPHGSERSPVAHHPRRASRAQGGELPLREPVSWRAGVATCTFDGPGQGEMYFQAKMRPDFHRFGLGGRGLAGATAATSTAAALA